METRSLRRARLPHRLKVARGPPTCAKWYQSASFILKVLREVRSTFKMKGAAYSGAIQPSRRAWRRRSTFVPRSTPAMRYLRLPRLM